MRNGKSVITKGEHTGANATSPNLDAERAADQGADRAESDIHQVYPKPGAALAVILILVASVAFSFYVANFGNYSATQGSLSALIGFLTWMWISIVLVIMDAVLNSEIEHQTAQDSTQGEERPVGERGAHVADTVA